MTQATQATPRIKVLIATDSERRGIFYGEIEGQTPEEIIKTGICVLTGLRNCIYWSKSIGGVFGLAESGPDSACVIGAKLHSKAWLNGVTFVAEVTQEAAEAWEAAPCVE